MNAAGSTAAETGAGALVIIPTYDEREALPSAIEAVLAAVPAAHILVVDDASPDGTGQLADAMAAADPRIRVLHRTTDRGLGRAYIAGFRFGIEAGYDVLVEMDADGSHPASALPTMLRTLDAGGPELVGVIGSRWVEGGSFVNWPRYRVLISRGGSWYSRTVLGLPVRDVTAGYRAYRADAIRDLADDLDSIESKGYCFQVDITRRLIWQGGRLAEVPIEFRDRELGVSKMSTGIVVEAMLKVTQWGIDRLLGRDRVAATRTADRVA